MVLKEENLGKARLIYFCGEGVISSNWKIFFTNNYLASRYIMHSFLFPSFHLPWKFLLLFAWLPPHKY